MNIPKIIHAVRQRRALAKRVAARDRKLAVADAERSRAELTLLRDSLVQEGLDPDTPEGFAVLLGVMAAKSGGNEHYRSAIGEDFEGGL